MVEERNTHLKSDSHRSAINLSQDVIRQIRAHIQVAHTVHRIGQEDLEVLTPAGRPFLLRPLHKNLWVSMVRDIVIVHGIDRWLREDLRQPMGLLANTWHAPKVWYIARNAVVSARRH